MIYLDNAATTFPKPEAVYEAVDHYNRTEAVNAGRGAYHAARAATQMIRDVKTELLSLCDAREQAEIVLTHSVTTALNQIIFGRRWTKDSVAYVSPYEHNAVLRPLRLLQKRIGISIRELPIDEKLAIDLEAVKRAFAECPPDFVAVSAVSNTTGYVLPAREIFLLAKEYEAFTLLDASQALGLLRLRFGTLRADALTFAGHKTLYAPFGIAGFLLRNGAELDEWLVGGNGNNSLSMDMPSYMPDKLESSSLNTPAIAGLQASLRWLKTVKPLEKEKELMDYLLPHLAATPGVTVYQAPEGAQQAGVVSFNLEGFRANEVAAILDEKWDIAVRAGHHCAALVHAHLQNKKYDGTVRVSVSYFTTKEELDILLEALKEINRDMLKDISDNILRGSC
ncbi:MAG: aminotransferase class V-fold PLP-dependent enzyme [Clostridiales bacterium]|nr:aminotransferase class V-fold PLP-dependent enzyme [Clostridiales bacterium]